MGNFKYSDLKNPLVITQIIFERIAEDDDTHGRPDEDDEGFWPSMDKNAPGYIGENPAVSFEDQQSAAEKRMAEYERGDWNYIGIRAKAVIKIPCHGSSCVTYTLTSPGLWGVESDSGEEYLTEIFEEQKAELLDHINTLAQGYEVKQ